MGQDEEDSFDESYVYEEFSGIRSSFEQLIDRLADIFYCSLFIFSHSVIL